MFTIRTYIPFEVEVGEPKKLKVSVKRMNTEEGATFRAEYALVENAKPKDKKKMWGKYLPDWMARFIQLEEEVMIDWKDGPRPATSADELLAVFGGDNRIMNQFLAALLGQSLLSTAEKKVLPSPTGSGSSSRERKRGRRGPKPARTARNVAPGDSAGNGDVTNEAINRSGSTGLPSELRSSSSSVQSLH